jgi:hypothetical protein
MFHLSAKHLKANYTGFVAACTSSFGGVFTIQQIR